MLGRQSEKSRWEGRGATPCATTRAVGALQAAQMPRGALLITHQAATCAHNRVLSRLASGIRSCLSILAPAPRQRLAPSTAVLPHQLVALDLVARICRLIQPARLVARAHVQPAAPADQAVAEAAAVKVLKLARLSHALQQRCNATQPTCGGLSAAIWQILVDAEYTAALAGTRRTTTLQFQSTPQLHHPRYEPTPLPLHLPAACRQRQLNKHTAGAPAAAPGTLSLGRPGLLRGRARSAPCSTRRASWAGGRVAPRGRDG